jgi:RNA polymerase sigma-70 factor, ECF subfamily
VHAPLPEGSRIEEIAAAVRSETATHLRTETKSRIARLRESLSEQDRMLLTLRVDRQLEWNELARVLHDGGEAELEGEALRRASARLRKRFQDVKEKLAELARREGLLDREG